MAYATRSDLEGWLWADPPDDTDRILQRASELIDSQLTAAVYTTDSGGLPTDAVVIAALRDATCAQVEFWIASEDELDLVGDWTSYSMAGLSVSREPPKRAVRLAPRARDVLVLNGLLPGRPLV